jgi:hypothetical protein
VVTSFFLFTMLRHCTIKTIRRGETKHLEHCYVEHCEPGAIVHGNHNSFKNCQGFSGSGNHNHFRSCTNVTWEGNHCTIDAHSSNVTLAGNFTYAHGKDCLIMGSHTTDRGSNNTLEPLTTTDTRRAARADQPYASMSFNTISSSGRSGRTILGNMTMLGGRHTGVSLTDANGVVSYYASMDDLPAVVNGDIVVGIEIPRQPPPAPVVLPQPAPPPPLPPAIEYPEAPRESEPSIEDAEKQCVLCMDRAKTTVAIPCGCSYACVTCIRASRPVACALCRTPLRGIFRLFNQ